MITKLSYALKTGEPLSEGWKWSAMEVVANVMAGNPAPQGQQYFEDGKYPFVRVQDMGRLGGVVAVVKTNDKINDKAIKNLRFFPKGTVLFTKSGASTLLNQRAILGVDAYVVSHIAAAIPKKGILSSWLYYWMRTIDFAYLAHATTLPSLPLSKAKAIPVPIAPLKQQKRIVDEIEKQFTRLDAAVDALKRVKVNLKRYRASVLKAACEGRLVPTEAELAQKEGRSYEPADVLLKRILKERRAKWEADQLAQMKAKEKSPKDDKWKEKYNEPTMPDNSRLPTLPQGWIWTTVEQIVENSLIGIDRNRSKQSIDSTGVPYVKMNNITLDGRINWRDLVYVKVSKEEQEQYCLNEGDLLFNTRNSLELVGKMGIVHNTPQNAIFNNNLMRIRLIKKIDPGFICRQMCASDFRNRMGLVKKATTNIAAIYRKDLLPLPIALPPENEQHRIVEEVERIFSVLEELEIMAETNLKKAERLRQSILKRAFEGKLIPQNPNDEPASVLLDRIREERDKAENEIKPKVKTKHQKQKVKKH